MLINSFEIAKLKNNVVAMERILTNFKNTIEDIDVYRDKDYEESVINEMKETIQTKKLSMFF